MAELWEKLKTMVMGTPDDYDEEYDDYDEDGYDEEYQETRSSKPKFDFMKNFRRSSANDDVEEEEEERSSSSFRSFSSSRNSNVIDINAKVKMSVVVVSPQTIDAACEVTRELRNNKTVIVNLEGLEKEMAQRITDFLSGACYALKGSLNPVSGRIYIIGPYDVDVTGEFKEELAASVIKLPKSVFHKRY